MKNRVDFLVIGAEKAGTTSLFRYIQRHPSLYLPAQKEINFFADEDRFRNGRDWYLKTHFSGADPRKLWGEASPQYMAYSSAPARIREAFPDVKLISILRNPIDRSYSHYRMAVRRGSEGGTFSEAVEDRLNRPPAPPETGGRDDSPHLLNFSMYGEAFERYLRHFERDQMLIVFQENLLDRPREVLAEIFSFLGVDETYLPPNLGEKYHVGGVERIPGLRAWVRRQRILKRVAKKVLRSPKNAQAVKFWIEVLNVRPVDDPGPSPAERDRLREVFGEDVLLLRRLMTTDPPWPEFADLPRERERSCDRGTRFR